MRAAPRPRARRRGSTGVGRLMAVGPDGLLVAVTESGQWGWAPPRPSALFAAGASCRGWVARSSWQHEPLVDMRMMALRGVWTTNLAAFLLGVGMYASIAVIPRSSSCPGAPAFGFGGSAIAAGLFMLPTAAPQLARRTAYRPDRAANRFASAAPGGDGRACSSPTWRWSPTRSASELFVATVTWGSARARTGRARQPDRRAPWARDQTGVATGMNTVMRTLGGAFGARWRQRASRRAMARRASRATAASRWRSPCARWRSPRGWPGPGWFPGGAPGACALSPRRRRDTRSGHDRDRAYGPGHAR